MLGVILRFFKINVRFYCCIVLHVRFFSHLFLKNRLEIYGENLINLFFSK